MLNWVTLVIIWWVEESCSGNLKGGVSFIVCHNLVGQDLAPMLHLFVRTLFWVDGLQPAVIPNYVGPSQFAFTFRLSTEELSFILLAILSPVLDSVSAMLAILEIASVKRPIRFGYLAKSLDLIIEEIAFILALKLGLLVPCVFSFPGQFAVEY